MEDNSKKAKEILSDYESRLTFDQYIKLLNDNMAYCVPIVWQKDLNNHLAYQLNITLKKPKNGFNKKLKC